MPGAFSAVPGGICERRSTFEWDNENRAALINVDDLSVDLSEDSDDDEDALKQVTNTEHDTESCVTGTATTTSRATTTESLETGTGQVQGDIEQGLPQSTVNGQQAEGTQQPTTQAPHQPQYQPRQPDAPVDAYVVERRNANNHPVNSTPVVLPIHHKPSVTFLGYARGVWIKAFVFVMLSLGLGMIVFWQRQGPKSRSGATDATGATSTQPQTSFAPPSPALAYRHDLGLQHVIQEILVADETGNTNNNKLQPNWTSPYYQALYWLLYEDPLQLTLGEEGDVLSADGNATVSSLDSPSALIQQTFPGRTRCSATSRHCGSYSPMLTSSLARRLQMISPICLMRLSASKICWPAGRSLQTTMTS